MQTVCVKPRLIKTRYNGFPIPLKIPPEMLHIHTTPELPALTQLPCPDEDHLLVYSPEEISTWAPHEWCNEIQRTLTEALPAHGALLLQGLPIRTLQDFEEIYEGLQQIADPIEWGPQKYESPGIVRPKLGKHNLAIGISKESIITQHTESIYNPVFPKYIGFMCLQDAKEGGENFIVHTKDVTNKVVPLKLKQMVEKHGGELITFKFYDATKNIKVDGAFLSWQKRCNLEEGEGRIEAEKFFFDLGYEPANLHWDNDGTLTIKRTYSGYIDDQWCNSLHKTFFCTLGDGTPIPEDVIAEYNALLWRQSYAFKLKPGDWLILENARVQHGRLQYENGSEPRSLIVNLWGKKQH